MKITLMRHGETDWNLAKRIQGIQPVPINANGIRQMEEACRYLNKQLDISFSCVVTSPLLRAMQSAQICGRLLHVPVEVRAEFQERSFGILEGKTHSEIELQFGISDIENLREGVYGIEPISELDKRIAHGFEILKTRFREENVLVMTHGSVIKRMAALHGVVKTGVIPNGSFIQLDI